MPAEETDDLYDGEYEFVDDEESAEAEPAEEAVEEKPKKSVKRKTAGAKKPARKKKKAPTPRAKEETVEQQEEEETVPSTEGVDAEKKVGDKSQEPATGDGETEGDEYGRTEPETNYVVHVYEVKKFQRTIDYKFTPEDADAFATEYNRTAKTYSRWAVPGKADVEPGKVLAQ